MKKTRNLISTISTLVILNGCSLHRENLTNINYPPKSIEYNMGFEYKGTIGSIVYLFLAEQIESKNYKISITPIKLSRIHFQEILKICLSFSILTLPASVPTRLIIIRVKPK